MNFSLTIPGLFFDLIARVVPGATFIIGFYIINDDVKKLISFDRLGEFSLFFVLVLLSYVMGFILKFIYSYVRKKYLKKFLVSFSGFLANEEHQGEYPPVVIHKIKSVLNKEYGNLDKLSAKQIDTIYYVTFDRISLKNAELNAILWKLHAEVHMLGNLLIAFMLLSVLSIFYKLSLLPIFLVFSYLSFGHLKRHNVIRLMRWINSLYALHKIESEASKTTQNKQ